MIHEAVFRGLELSGVDDASIATVRKMYAEQFAFIDLGNGSKSRLFNILRGVRQGDPLSPSLFANSIRICMSKLKAKWEREGLGTTVGSNFREKDRISYAMFADDTTLIAKSKRSLQKMLHDIQEGLAEIGLNLNADKCYIQSSRPLGRSCSLQVDGASFPIISRDEGFKILGTTYTLNGNTDLEFDKRMNAAYGKFHELWPLLGKRDANMNKRIKLFEATVTKSALWCSESWTLSVAQKRNLRAVQRSMLRRIAGPRRHAEEDYLTWIRPATKTADERAREAGCDCWLKQFLRKKWAWGGSVMRMSSERLALRATCWRDSKWWSLQPRGSSAYGVRPMRARPGKVARWEGDFQNFSAAQGWASWQDAAKSENLWDEAEELFVEMMWR